MSYGMEVIVDLRGCEIENLTQDGLRKFVGDLVDAIDMEPEDIHFWPCDPNYWKGEEVEDEEHIVGHTCVQFIRTSNITVHTLTLLCEVYVNVFSCKHVEEEDVLRVCHNTLRPTDAQVKTIKRGNWG